MIRAVLFDFGRVISAQKPESLFRGYEEDLGLSPGTINTIMFESDAWRDALLGKMTMEQFWTVIGPRLGLDLPRAVEDFRLRYYADEKINGEVVRLIRGLHGSYRLAVCSNSPPGLSRWLKDWDLDYLFDVVFCSGDEGIVKPDPAAYRQTLARLSVKPQEAVFVDDAPENVAAAEEEGLTALLFTDAPTLEKELASVLSIPPVGRTSRG